MKLNNYSYINEVRTVVLYDQEQNETEKTINPYNSKAFYQSRNIYGEPLEMYDDYYRIIVPELVECKNNPTHIKSKEKRGLIFVVWLVDKYGSVYGSLYIPKLAIISHKIEEEKKDYRGRGCVCVSYNDRLVFDPLKIRIECEESRTFFAKKDEPAPDGRCDIESIKEEIEKQADILAKYPTIKPDNRRRYVALLEQKLSEGYEYKVKQYRWKKVSADYLVLYNCIDHYEKTPEYIKLEKLTNQLKAINKHWDEEDTVRLLAQFKLTKKRGNK